MGFSIFAIDRLIMQITTVKYNDFNQAIESYEDGDEYKVDCQVVTQELIQETYGKDIDCQFIVFSDDKLPEVSTCRIPDYNDKKYRISNELPWRGMLGPYYIYTLTEVE